MLQGVRDGYELNRASREVFLATEEEKFQVFLPSVPFWSPDADREELGELQCQACHTHMDDTRPGRRSQALNEGVPRIRSLINKIWQGRALRCSREGEGSTKKLQEVGRRALVQRSSHNSDGALQGSGSVLPYK